MSSTADGGVKLPDRGVQLGEAVRVPHAPLGFTPTDGRVLQGVLLPLPRLAAALLGLFWAVALSALMTTKEAA